MTEIYDFGLQQHKVKMSDRFFEGNLVAIAGDSARRLEVQLLDNNSMVQDTTGLKLRLNANVGGTPTYSEATLVNAKEGIYHLDLSNGMLLTPGTWEFQWQISDEDDNKLNSFSFSGTIGNNIAEGGTEATNFYLNVDNLKKMQEDFINGTIDSALLETNIAEKLKAKEIEYAPQLAEVTTQLAEKADKSQIGAPTQTQVDTWLNQNPEATTTVLDGAVTPLKTSFLEVTTSKNLLDETKTTHGTIVLVDGKYATSGIAPDYFATDFIPVTTNSKVAITKSGSGAWYTSEKVPLGTDGFAASSINRILTPPETAGFIRVTFHNNQKGIAMVAKDVLPPNYTSFQDMGIALKTEKQKSTFATSLKPYLSIEQPDEEPQSFKFKEWNAIGDSITELNSTANTKYYKIISDKTGVLANNYGYSGTGYMQTYGDNKAIWNRLNELSPSADLITVFAGTNDRSKPLGEFGDADITTIYGAIDVVMNGLINKFPTKTIAFFTPIPRSDNWVVGGAGTTIEMIADAIIKLGGKYSIPVLDLYRSSNLHPWNETANSELFSNADGLHPNNQGHGKIADKIYVFLKNL